MDTPGTRAESANDASPFDVGGVRPEARAIVARSAAVYVEHLGDDLMAVVAHGSAVKGGYIPGCSDVDLRLSVAPRLMSDAGAIPLARAAAIYRDLMAIPLAPFRYLQTYAHPKRLGPDFIPGAYWVVYGDRGVPLATAASLLPSAHEALRRLDPAAHEARISRELIEGRAGNLDRELRYLCTDVWPALFHVLCASGHDPLAMWRLSKDDAVALTDTETAPGEAIRTFLAAVTAHYASFPHQPEAREEAERVLTALAAIEAGLAFLRAASAWYHERE